MTVGRLFLIMRILIAGGSGFIGSHLAHALNDERHDVVVLSRHPDEELAETGVETRVGDVTDEASLTSALEGVDTVVNLVALSPLFEPKGGERMHDVVHRQGTANLVRAAESAGVTRFVQLSAVNAAPDGPTAYLRAKGRAEEIVRNAGLEWTIVRPSVVFGDGGEFISFTRKVAPPVITPLPGGGRTRFQPIWIEDFVPMLVELAVDPTHAGTTVEIGGPEILTLAEIARQVHAAEGRSVTVIPLPMGLARVGMTIGGAIPGFPFGADQYRSLTLDLVVDEDDMQALASRPERLTTLADYLEQKP